MASGCAQRFADTFTAPDSKAFFARNRAAYRNLAATVSYRFRGRKDPCMWDSLYEREMNRWVTALSSDTYAAGHAQVAPVTVWDPAAHMPEPSAPFAAWALAMHACGYGVAGARTLPPEVLQHVLKPYTLLLIETAKGYRFVKRIQRRGPRLFLQLSDDSRLGCNRAGADRCFTRGVRQWIVLTENREQACALSRIGITGRDRAGYMFWYPRALKHYIRHVRENAHDNPFPEISDTAVCN
jgi:hypothetical protein